MSRSASASQRPRPRIACCRQGPGSPAASARIHPVLRRSAPSSPSRNRPADAATRSCVNNGRIRAFTSRSDAAQSSSVSSIDAPLIHALPITREKVRAPHQNCNCSARGRRGTDCRDIGGAAAARRRDCRFAPAARPGRRTATAGTHPARRGTGETRRRANRPAPATPGRATVSSRTATTLVALAALMTPAAPDPAAIDPFEVARAELVEGLARMVNRVIQHGKAEAQSALDQIEVIRTTLADVANIDDFLEDLDAAERKLLLYLLM